MKNNLTKYLITKWCVPVNEIVTVVAFHREINPALSIGQLEKGADGSECRIICVERLSA